MGPKKTSPGVSTGARIARAGSELGDRPHARSGATRPAAGLPFPRGCRCPGPIPCRPCVTPLPQGSLPAPARGSRLRYDQVLLALERDLDRRLPEEQPVVADLGLHGEVLDVRAVDLPWLVVHAGGLGHGRPRPSRDDATALYLAALDSRGG